MGSGRCILRPLPDDLLVDDFILRTHIGLPHHYIDRHIYDKLPQAREFQWAGAPAVWQVRTHSDITKGTNTKTCTMTSYNFRFHLNTSHSTHTQNDQGYDKVDSVAFVYVYMEIDAGADRLEQRVHNMLNCIFSYVVMFTFAFKFAADVKTITIRFGAHFNSGIKTTYVHSQYRICNTGRKQDTPNIPTT